MLRGARAKPSAPSHTPRHTHLTYCTDDVLVMLVKNQSAGFHHLTVISFLTFQSSLPKHVARSKLIDSFTQTAKSTITRAIAVDVFFVVSGCPVLRWHRWPTQWCVSIVRLGKHIHTSLTQNIANQLISTSSVNSDKLKLFNRVSAPLN